MSPYRFMAWVLLLLLPFFGLWYATGALPVAPAFYVSQLALENLLPGLVGTINLDGTRMLVVSTFGELDGATLPAREAGNQLAFPAETRLVSYSIPFFAALLFASRVSQPVERFARGLILLWLVMALSLISICLKNLMLGLGANFYTAAGVPLPPPPVIALLYQLSTLILPTLAPVLAWLWLARDSAVLAQMGPRPETPTAEP